LANLVAVSLCNSYRAQCDDGSKQIKLKEDYVDRLVEDYKPDKQRPFIATTSPEKNLPNLKMNNSTG